MGGLAAAPEVKSVRRDAEHDARDARATQGRLHSPSHAGGVLAPMGIEEKLTVMFSEEVVEGEENLTQIL